MSALRPRQRGVSVDVAAGVAVGVQIGVPASAALFLISEFAAGINAAMRKQAENEQ